MVVTVETVQLHQSGWALLVIKAKIYLWRYNGKVRLLPSLVNTYHFPRGWRILIEIILKGRL